MSNGVRPLNEELLKYRFIRIHPVWYSFIKYCGEIKYGEIEKLKIQDGLPMIAEEVKKKIKFSERD
ncbi:MAG: hypothetical protein ACETWK_07230 [Candidatus Aminicenantaceae bacterium]